MGCLKLSPGFFLSNGRNGMDLSGPIRDWHAKKKWRMSVSRETQLRRAAAGTRGCCQARRFACGFVEVIARELGVQERELVLRHAGGRQGWRAAGQAEVVEDFDDDGGVSEEGEHAQKGGAFRADEGGGVEGTFELVGPGVAVALWRWRRGVGRVRGALGLRCFGHRPRHR